MNTYVSILLQDEAGIVPETEDRPSTAVEPNSVGLVLHVAEVTDRSMMDAAAEDKKKKKKGVDGSGVSSGTD
ncbi:unnamed protein product [Prunus armeniaca]|uniref:Uncharacterized protein n=1 Tax=Prunus armeniaca TaxID=36596 RepID=A0A6J5WFI6_PRUAR|nr:unnamed protein product [Prunus armeniaca]CAB4300540.1 unnamed protein product [Prunus armeniaca]